MTRHTYEEVEHPFTKTVPCRVCGKKLKRSTTLSQTINPFNRNAAGDPKTRQEIRAELKAKAETWQPVNDIHAGCVQAEREAQGAQADAS
jgi:hypothetical protein